jgi:steroid 5-alpha reductase family enzyme
VLNSTQNQAAFAATDVIGGLLFCLGLGLEALADSQKAQWAADKTNKGKWIENAGLWTYSRHPNYFFEWLLQFGLFVVCTAEIEGSQWVVVGSPLFIAFLLGAISGVPMLETRANQKWGENPDYLVYRRRTSTCIPWCQLGPKNSAAELGPLRKLLVTEGWFEPPVE